MTLDSKDLFENHLALLVAIRCETTPERAFRRVRKLLDNPKGMINRLIEEDDMPFIYEMHKSGISAREIAKAYCVSYRTILDRLSDYRRKIEAQH